MIEHEILHGHFRKMTFAMTFCYVRFMLQADVTTFCEGIQTCVYLEADYQDIGVTIEGLFYVTLLFHQVIALSLTQYSSAE